MRFSDDFTLTNTFEKPASQATAKANLVQMKRILKWKTYFEVQQVTIKGGESDGTQKLLFA
jgi:hypothetical protein